MCSHTYVVDKALFQHFKSLIYKRLESKGDSPLKLNLKYLLYKFSFAENECK